MMHIYFSQCFLTIISSIVRSCVILFLYISVLGLVSMNDPISCIAFIIIVLSKIKAVCLSVYGREIPKGKNGWETTENQQRTMLKRLAEMV